MNQFLLGMAKCFDLWGVLSEPPPALTDEEALRRDWEVVGNDLREAIKAVIADAESKRDTE